MNESSKKENARILAGWIYVGERDGVCGWWYQHIISPDDKIRVSSPVFPNQESVIEWLRIQLSGLCHTCGTELRRSEQALCSDCLAISAATSPLIDAENRAIHDLEDHLTDTEREADDADMANEAHVTVPKRDTDV